MGQAIAAGERVRSSAGALVRAAVVAVLLLSSVAAVSTATAPVAHAGDDWCATC